jgi:hypothetical protein
VGKVGPIPLLHPRPATSAPRKNIVFALALECCTKSAELRAVCPRDLLNRHCGHWDRGFLCVSPLFRVIASIEPFETSSVTSYEKPAKLTEFGH